jgi:hypothetical protein
VTTILHKRGKGIPTADKFTDVGEILIDSETGIAYTLNDSGDVVASGGDGLWTSKQEDSKTNVTLSDIPNSLSRNFIISYDNDEFQRCSLNVGQFTTDQIWAGDIYLDERLNGEAKLTAKDVETETFKAVNVASVASETLEQVVLGGINVTGLNQDAPFTEAEMADARSIQNAFTVTHSSKGVTVEIDKEGIIRAKQFTDLDGNPVGGDDLSSYVSTDPDVYNERYVFNGDRQGFTWLSNKPDGRKYEIVIGQNNFSPSIGLESAFFIGGTTPDTNKNWEYSINEYGVVELSGMRLYGKNGATIENFDSVQATDFLDADGNSIVGGLPEGESQNILSHNGKEWVATDAVQINPSTSRSSLTINNASITLNTSDGGDGGQFKYSQYNEVTISHPTYGAQLYMQGQVGDPSKLTVNEGYFVTVKATDYLDADGNSIVNKQQVLTQSEYDSLTPDPDTVYFII